jgi:hypothetical protein
MVDVPDTMVDLPDTMADLPDTILIYLQVMAKSKL